MIKVTVKLNNLRIAPRKVSLVVDQIRGKNISEALLILDYQQKSGSLPVKKLLLSAINALEIQHETDTEGIDVSIYEVYVTEGEALKRYRPASRGRMSPYKKRGCHVVLTLVVDDEKLSLEDSQKSEDIKLSSDWDDVEDDLDDEDLRDFDEKNKKVK